MTADKPQGAKAPNTFENGLARLEDLVNQLENDELSLDDSLKAFEEGMGLVKKLTGQLNEANRKIEILVGERNGQPVAADFNRLEE